MKLGKAKKTLDDFSDLQPLLKHELEIHEPSEGHSKFWRCYVYVQGSDYFVVRHWGRNGAKGQQMVESFDSKYQALDAAGKVYGEKLRKGYKAEASPLDKIVREV